MHNRLVQFIRWTLRAQQNEIRHLTALQAGFVAALPEDRFVAETGSIAVGPMQLRGASSMVPRNALVCPGCGTIARQEGSVAVRIVTRSAVPQGSRAMVVTPRRRCVCLKDIRYAEL